VQRQILTQETDNYGGFRTSGSFHRKIGSQDTGQSKKDGCLARRNEGLAKKTTACQEAKEACLEKAKANPVKMKAGLEETEAAFDVFEERLNKMDTTDLEANRDKSEAVAVHEEDEVETVEHWRTDMGTGVWL
jgi:hypothetical protein